jgi:predicted  nucleic acid-binding Zn-ribbon protein
MASDCVEWVAQVGVASVREYEETHIRKARERETQLLELQQQESRLAARLTFEERKALSTAAKKLRDSMAKDEKELSALKHKLRLGTRRATSSKRCVLRSATECHRVPCQ